MGQITLVCHGTRLKSDQLAFGRDTRGRRLAPAWQEAFNHSDKILLPPFHTYLTDYVLSPARTCLLSFMRQI